MNQEVLNKISNLPGWCPTEKAYHLFNLVKFFKPKMIVEIGVYGGRSLLALSEGANGLDSQVIGIDPFDNENIVQYDIYGNQSPEFIVNWLDIKKSAYGAVMNYNTKILPIPAEHAFELINTKIDLIHIDGNHSEDSVLKDLNLWTKKLNKDAIVVMDDIDWPTVKSAIDKFGKLKQLENQITYGIYKYLG